MFGNKNLFHLKSACSVNSNFSDHIKMEEKQVKKLKLLAKESMKKEKYTEAFLHLTHALKLVDR